VGEVGGADGGGRGYQGGGCPGKGLGLGGKRGDVGCDGRRAIGGGQRECVGGPGPDAVPKPGCRAPDGRLVGRPVWCGSVLELPVPGLSEHECKVVVDAACYSAATLILTLGEVTMRPGTLLMFHAPSASASGTAEKLGDAVTYLANIRASAAALYASKSGKTVEKADALMTRETWMTPDKAKEYGFCQIVEGAPVEAVAFVRSTAGMKLSADAPDSVRMIADPVSYVAGLFGTEANAVAISDRIAALKSTEATSAEMRANVEQTAAKLLAETEAHKATAATLKAAQDAVLRFEERVAKGVAQLAASARVAPVPVTQSAVRSSAQLWEEYRAIPDTAARTTFYRANKAAIDASYTRK
jgi:hypothetical protein